VSYSLLARYLEKRAEAGLPDAMQQHQQQQQQQALQDWWSAIVFVETKVSYAAAAAAAAAAGTIGLVVCDCVRGDQGELCSSSSRCRRPGGLQLCS
jgi:hypothetical protein